MSFQFGYHPVLSFREDKQSTKGEDKDINVNNNIVKQDVIMTSSAEEIEPPNNDEDIVREEEFYQCNSTSMVSVEKSKMAELNDRARLLQAQFEVENRKAVERIEKVKEEITSSQEKETTITQECEEIKKRTHSLREDMKFLEKKAEERETLEGEERKKIAKKKRRIERKLKKTKAKTSAATETLGMSKDIEDEITEDVDIKEPLSSNQTLVNSDDKSTGIQTKKISFGEDGAASIKVKMNTLPCCRPEKCCLSMNGCLFTSKFDDRQLLQIGLKLKGTVSAVVNISEQLLQKELLNVLKAVNAVQNTRAFTVSYVKQPAEIEMKDEVSSEQENHEEKGHYHMKGERSEIVNGEKALCIARGDHQVSLADAAQDEQDNFVSEIVDVTNNENEKLKNKISALKEEAKTFEIEKQSLQTELETVRLELKRLTFSELETKKERASKMVIYSEEMRKNVHSKRKKKKKKRKNEIRKLRKEQGDLEEELVSTKQHLTQKEHELEETKQTLPFLTETAKALKQRVLEMNYLFENSSTLNSDLSSIPDDCSLNDCASLLDFNSVVEAGTQGEENAGYGELSFDNEVQVESKELITEEMKSGSEELTSQTDEESTETLLTTTAEEGSKAVETQLMNLHQILKDSHQELQEFKTALRQKQDSWKNKKNGRVMADARVWLNNELWVRENQMEMMTRENAEIMENLNATIIGLEEELGDTQLLLEGKTEALEQTEAILQLQTSLLTSKEATHKGIVKQLQEDLESTETLLKEKTEALEKTEVMLQLQTSLLTSREAKHDDIEKQLQEDLEITQTLLKEKTEALEQSEAMLQLQTSFLASREAKHDDIEKQLQEDIESTHTLLQEKTEALEKTETMLQLQASLLTSREAKHEDVVKQLQEDLESTETLLKEKTEALEYTDAKLHLQASLLATEEAKYEDMVKQLEKDLEDTHALLKEKKDELEKTEIKLQSQETVFTSTEGKYEEIITQFQEELANMYTSLKERTQTLEKTEARLQWLTSFFESTESKYEDVIKQLQGELESMHALAKERTTVVKQTQATLCLNNEKGHVVQKMKFKAVELTQDEVELIVAELARTKSEKTKLLREVTDVTARLELEKRMGKRDKDVLWKLFNAALKELEAKTKMNPEESTIQPLWLGFQKREMQVYDSNYEQSKKESKPMIGSINQENYELKGENQRLNILLRQRIDEMTHGVEDAPSRPLTVRGVFTHLL